jgi:hypothetical protein
MDGLRDAADVLGDAYEIPPGWVRSMLGPTFPTCRTPTCS